MNFLFGGLVFGRGFEENSDRIQINTDLRSRKVLEIFQIMLDMFRRSCIRILALFDIEFFCNLLQIEELKHCPFSEVSNYLRSIWIIRML